MLGHVELLKSVVENFIFTLISQLKNFLVKQHQTNTRLHSTGATKAMVSSEFIFKENIRLHTLPVRSIEFTMANPICVSYMHFGYETSLCALQKPELLNSRRGKKHQMCAIEWVQHTSSLLKYIVKTYKHGDINSFSMFYDRILFFFTYCFVRFNRTFEFWSYDEKEKTHITKWFFWEGGVVRPIS